jgi:hypothetical protein
MGSGKYLINSVIYSKALKSRIAFFFFKELGPIMRSFIIILFFHQLVYANTTKQYQVALDEVNDYLAYNQNEFFGCPGTKLVISCGNQVCEAFKGETLENCPADCKKNVSVRSYNNITLCDGYTQTHVPHSVNEIVDIVKMANFLGQKVKAIGASHSATEIMCAEGILIPTRQLNKVLGISKLDNIEVVEVEAGATVFELSEWLYEKGYALKGLPHMGFRDVTIAGAMATGSHGSTPKHIGVISNIVEAVEIVDGQGQVHYFERAKSESHLFKALSAHLGLLGIITKVKLEIAPAFNLGVKISYHHENEILKNGLLNSVKDCDYGQLNWFPGANKFMKTCGVKTSEQAHRGATNELLSPKIPNFIVNPFKKVLQYGACHNKVMCMVEQVRYLQFKLQPPVLYTNQRGKKKNAHYVVGPAHRMVSSHLIKEQDGFFQMDWEIAVPASRAQAALLAIREHAFKNATCLPLVGVFIRFAPSDDRTLLAHTVSDNKDWIKGEPAVFFEMPVYVPVGLSKEQFDQYEKQFNEFTAMLVKNFSGRPHWGKNRQWAFDLTVQMNAYGDNLDQFKAVMQKLDPNEIFSNEFAHSLKLHH